VAGARLSGDRAMQAAQIRDVNSAAALKDAQTNDVYATQADRIDLMIAQRQNSLSGANLSSEQARKVQNEIDVLKAQRDQIRANTASTIVDTEKKKLLSRPFKAVNDMLDNVPRPKNPPGSKDREKETFNWKTWKKVFGK